MSNELDHPAINRVITGLMARIKSSRTVLIIAAAQSDELQEILNLVTQLEIRLTLYVAHDIERIEHDLDKHN